MVGVDLQRLCVLDMWFVSSATILLSAFWLGACATTPPASSLPSSPAAPSSTATPAGVFASILPICDGDHIDNAPAADGKKHIVGYNPFAYVSGATLARAPVERACFSSGFGRRHDRAGFHNGVDLSTGHPHTVYAGAGGVVEEMRSAGGYGNMILMRHNDRVQTRYGHLSAYAANMHLGHEVRQGDIIGKTGKTGNAEAVILHYEIIVDGQPRNPMSVGE